jgi:dihydrofolate synthase / folylpolyglutamate synthase
VTLDGRPGRHDPAPGAKVLDRLFALETFGIKLGLTNITRLCEALGHPERALTTVHVAGTNGKGSVTAMTHAALLAAGVRAGRYTSPHLADLRERFVIEADPIDTESLESAARLVLDTADALVTSGALPAPPTFFEATTAMAFELFRRHAVDVGVVEVGLGGRFDATNVIAPAVCAITSIAMDHQQQLGDSLAAIAFEKAGILKRGVPAVVGQVPAEAWEAIAAVARDCGVRLIPAAEGVDVLLQMEDGRARLRLRTSP